MSEQLVPIDIQKIEQTKAYTLFVLGNETKHFAIYAESQVASNIQDRIDQSKSRPKTLHLMDSIFNGLDIRPFQVILQDVEKGVYFARLFLQQTRDGKEEILEIDARPSDCLSLAIEHDLPIFSTKSLFEKAFQVNTFVHDNFRGSKGGEAKPDEFDRRGS